MREAVEGLSECKSPQKDACSAPGRRCRVSTNNGLAAFNFSVSEAATHPQARLSRHAIGQIAAFQAA